MCNNSKNQLWEWPFISSNILPQFWHINNAPYFTWIGRALSAVLTSHKSIEGNINKWKIERLLTRSPHASNVLYHRAPELLCDCNYWNTDNSGSSREYKIWVFFLLTPLATLCFRGQLWVYIYCLET